jgi:hypothetical protein
VFACAYLDLELLVEHIDVVEAAPAVALRTPEEDDIDT